MPIIGETVLLTIVPSIAIRISETQDHQILKVSNQSCFCCLSLYKHYLVFAVTITISVRIHSDLLYIAIVIKVDYNII